MQRPSERGARVSPGRALGSWKRGRRGEEGAEVTRALHPAQAARRLGAEGSDRPSAPGGLRAARPSRSPSRGRARTRRERGAALRGAPAGGGAEPARDGPGSGALLCSAGSAVCRRGRQDVRTANLHCFEREMT